ncbi:MAG: hypothetical protein AAFN81_10735 [Bacteroidota bacterium]
MTIDVIENIFKSPIYDIDIKSKSDFLLINEKGVICRNRKRIDAQLKLSWPIVRIISEELFLLVDADKPGQEDNAWIINSLGKIEIAFYIGKAINIVLISNHIVASYSKCSLDTSRLSEKTYENPNHKSFFTERAKNKDVSGEGLAVFDFKGNCSFKYMSDSKDTDFIPFMEIYSFLRKDEKTVYLLSYLFRDGYTILEFNLETYALKKVIDLQNMIPKGCSPKAMTRKNDEWYFMMNYYEETEEGGLGNLKAYVLKGRDNQSLEQIAEYHFARKAYGNPDSSFAVIPFQINQAICNPYHIRI